MRYVGQRLCETRRNHTTRPHHIDANWADWIPVLKERALSILADAKQIAVRNLGRTASADPIWENTQDQDHRMKHSTSGVRRPREGARPGWRSNSLSVSASRQLWKQRPPIRDPSETRPPVGHEDHFTKHSRDWTASTTERSRTTDRPNKTSVGFLVRARESKSLVPGVRNREAVKTETKDKTSIPKPPSRPYDQRDSTKNRGVFRLHNNRDPPRKGERNKLLGFSGQRRRSDPKAIMAAGASKWRTAVDPSSGRTYYYHVDTRETQWRKPLDLASDEEKEEMRKKEER